MGGKNLISRIHVQSSGTSYEMGEEPDKFQTGLVSHNGIVLAAIMANQALQAYKEMPRLLTIWKHPWFWSRSSDGVGNSEVFWHKPES